MWFGRGSLVYIYIFNLRFFLIQLFVFKFFFNLCFVFYACFLKWCFVLFVCLFVCLF